MKQNTLTKTRHGVTATTTAAVNHEGRPAMSHDDKTELFVLGVGRFYGEESFYESGNAATKRYKELVRSVTKSDPEWVVSFLSWLRNEGNIRTAAIVGACEYVHAGGSNGRAVVRSVIVRGDEPAELLAYWINTYGRRLSQPIKRGIADSATRLFTERNYAKYDSLKRGVRFADVLELTHPRPSGPNQSELFKFVLDDRHGRGDLSKVPTISEARACSTRQDYLTALGNGNQAITWENVSSAGTGSMSADEWLMCYDHMGYMAQIRNLRNLDQAGVAVKEKRRIGEYLSDPTNVAKSRQLPLRFYSAYKSVSDDTWKGYLSEALDHSLDNVPRVAGQWLVLIDASASMTWGQTKGVSYYENACVFGAAFARANGSDLRTYASHGQLSPVYDSKGQNTLRIVKDLTSRDYYFSGGTDTAENLGVAFKQGKYNGVLLITDEQYTGYGDPGDSIPASVPLYTFNVAGYGKGHDIAPNRITVAGLNDSAFSMISSIEGSKIQWPWE